MAANLHLQYHHMGSYLLDQHLAHLRAIGRSPKTVEARRSVLRRLHNHLPFGLAYAATEQLESWLGALRESGRARWTLRTYDNHVRDFYRWACNAGFLNGDPTGELVRPAQPRCIARPVTEDEMAAALQLPEPLKTAVALAGFEGMRAGEIAACDRAHITAERTLIPVGKGGHAGVVPTHPYIWELVRDRPPGRLIRNKWGRAVSAHWVSVRISWWMRQIGLEGVTAHRFRHRYGTLIQQSVGDIRVTQECLRHSSVASTQIYTAVTSEARTRAVAGLPVPDMTAPAS